MTKTADVVVIGGGINGCSTAHALAARGAGRVLLVEKAHIASGPTGRSSGVVRQHYTTKTLAQMARDSVHVLANFAELVGGEAGFVQCGVVFIAGADQAAVLATTVEMHTSLGIRETLLNANDLRALEPRLNTEDVACGAYEPDGGYADPALAANAYADAARRLGVEVWQRTRVTALRIEGGRVAGVSTDKGDVVTRAVVNTAGVWGAEIAAMAGVPIPITVTRHPVVVMQRPPAWRERTPVWGDLARGWYFKPDGVSGMLIGGIRDESHAVEIDSHADVPSPDEVTSAAEAILHRFPVMEEGLAQRGWAGLYDVTPDSQPVIDRISDVGGLTCAVGFSGHGFKIAPAVGRIVSELVLDGDCRSYDIGVFRHSRFDRGDLHRGGYAYGIIG